jgi:hypothetical protein
MEVRKQNRRQISEENSCPLNRVVALTYVERIDYENEIETNKTMKKPVNRVATMAALAA